ncbi:MAG: hypothetical protein JNL32_14950, partial [Candidatus Kapabacteria bacterium]|nr:hypothetical protein [Candidatus Kapabacteria bacterium]
MDTTLSITIVAPSAESLRLRSHISSIGISPDHIQRVATLQEFASHATANSLLIFSTVDSDTPLFLSLDALVHLQQSGVCVFLIVPSFDDYCIAQSHGLRYIMYDCDGYAPLQQLDVCIDHVSRLIATTNHTDVPSDSTKQDILSFIERIIALRLPDHAVQFPWLRKASTWIASMLPADEVAKINTDILESVLRIFPLSRLSLPDAKKKSPCTIDGHGYDSILSQLPLTSDDLFDGLHCFEQERVILRSLFENYDGTGFPDQKQHWQIPMAARILRPLIELMEYKLLHGTTTYDALTYIKRFQRIAYDPRIILLLEEYVTMVDTATESDIRSIDLDALEDGMVLARDIVTHSGM